MSPGKKTVRRGGNHIRGQTTKHRPITRQQSALLCGNDENKENKQQFALIELTLHKKLLVVNYNDLVNLNKQTKIKLGSTVLVKRNNEQSTSGTVFCIGSEQECLNELDIINHQRNNKIKSDSDDDSDDSSLLITTTLAIPKQKEIDQNKNTNTLQETDYCISFDISQDESSSNLLPSKSPLNDKPSSSDLISINHVQNSKYAVPSSKSSIDITAAVSKRTPLSTNGIPATTTSSNLQCNRLDVLSDLTVQLNDVTKDREKWKAKYSLLEKKYFELENRSMLIPTDDNICEWVGKLYDATQRQVNSNIDFDRESKDIGIPSNLLKYYVSLSKPPTSLARKLFQQLCPQEVTEGVPWAKIPNSKIEAIHVFGEKVFGCLKWDKKVIKTSLQSFLRGERSNLKHDQDNDYPNDQNPDQNGPLVVEPVDEHAE